MIPAPRAAKTHICFGMNSPSASGSMPAESAKSSAPRLRPTRRELALAISAIRKKAEAVSTIASILVVPSGMPRSASSSSMISATSSTCWALSAFGKATAWTPGPIIASRSRTVMQRRFVEGAAKRGADAIILDLEDSVAASEKERARTLVPEAAEIVSRGGADVVVRLNRPMRMTVRDLEAIIGPGVHAVALPKAESAQHVELVAEIMDELEAERGIPLGTTKMLAMVETGSAFFRIAEIAKASSRLVGLR